MPGLDKSYRWWREHGGRWPAEIKNRLGRIPYYHIQQILLADAISRCAPAKVLEFGCGFGRHLAYLRHIPGVELYGTDQSASMLSGLSREGAKTAAARIVRNDPLAKLPFKDNAFDVAYTVNTLLHVPPRDIRDVLAELMRVTRSRILHFEPAHGVALDTQAHDGCFDHDYQALYAALGGAVLQRAPYCRIQEAIVVDLGRSRPQPVWPKATLRALLQLDTDMDAPTEHAASLEAGLRASLDHAARLEAELQAAVAAEGETRERLNHILASRTWRYGIRLAHTPIGRLAGRVLRTFGR